MSRAHDGRGASVGEVAAAPGGKGVQPHVATKQVKQLDRVIIRFAGDSGDGMQLTGDRFTQESAAFGNDLSTLPNFPAEIRAPQGTLPGVSSFQVHFADHDILTPGDAPDVLVAMNPAALRANLGDLPAGAAIIVDTHDFSARNLTKAGYEKSPLEDDSLASYAVHPLDLTGMTVEAVKEFGLSRKDAGRAKNMFALGLLSWMYGRPTETTIAFLEKRFAKVPDIRDANITAYRAGWNFGETTETFVVKYEIKPAPMKVGTYRNITGNLALSYGLVASGGALGAARVPGVLPDHAGVRHPPRAQQAQVVRRHDLPGRGRDRRHRRRPRCGLRGRARGDHDLRPRPGAEVRDHRPRGDDRAPAAGDRRPARRPLDRAPDEDRAGRPAPGDVRPQRRVAGADRRAAVAGRLLRRRPRGRPDRRHLPHAGDAAVRRHAGQRLRAVADPRARRAAHDRPRLRDRPQPGLGRRGGVLAVPPRRGDPGPAVGHPRHGWSRAPHRRPREGRRQRQHLLRPRQPRLHGPHPPGQGGPDRGEPAAPRGRRPVRQGWAGREGARAGVGVDVRADRRRLPPRPPRRLPRRAGPPAPPQPAAARPRRDPEALRPGAHPRDEPRPAEPAGPGEVPRRRRRLPPGQRHAAQGRRPRPRHRRPGRRGRGHRGPAGRVGRDRREGARQ